MRGLLNTNLSLYQTDNYFDFPELSPVSDYPAADYLDFDTARTYRRNDKSDKAIHFFIDDYKFNCIWEKPNRYLEFLKQFKYLIMPDFSLYYDYPVALQIFNKYRNHWLSRFWSDNGITVIPSISFSLPVHFDWSILGYPKQSVIAFSDLGIAKGTSYKDILEKSFRTMCNELDPIKIIYFTRSEHINYDFCEVVKIPYLKGVKNG